MCFAGKCDRCKKQVDGRAYWNGYHLCSKCDDLVMPEPTQSDIDEARRIIEASK